MKVTITIQADNAAFEPSVYAEVARILGWLSGRLENETSPACDGDRIGVYDANGNRVGAMEVAA